MIFWLLGGMKRSIKAVNYGKVRAITQLPDENPFLTRLTEAIHKYSGTDLDSPGVETVLAMYTVNQSTSEIWRKLQRLALGPQTSMKELIAVASSVLHS